MAEKKPTGMDFFRAGYDKSIDPKDLFEKEEEKEVPAKPSIYDLILQGYKQNEQK